MIHDLKIQQPWYERVADGEKTCEVREHDRDFQPGDMLRLTLVNTGGVPINQDANPPLEALVTHVLDARFSDGITHGYCVLSIHLTDDGQVA